MVGQFITADTLLEGWTRGEAPALSFGMGYTYDPNKDTINRGKHGYGLDSGEDLLRRITQPWGMSPPVVGLTDVGRDDGEPRYRILSLDHEGQLIDFVFTVRGDGDDYLMRAISYRRAAYDPTLLHLFIAHVDLDECIAWSAQCARDGLTQPPGWELVETMDSARRKFLSTPRNADVLVAALREGATLSIVPQKHGPLERADPEGLRHYWRIALQWTAQTPLGVGAMDYLFNGCRGLRYYYAWAPVYGEAYTRLVLRALAPDAYAAFAALDVEAARLARLSYDALSAKLWPAEAGLGCVAPADAVPELLHPRWSSAHRAWRADPQQQTYKTGWGIQAPVPSGLEIKGGFVRDGGMLWVPQDKVDRAHQIHRWGWS